MANARTIVFPSRNNVTYRSGFIKLTAFGSEFDQATIEGHTENVVDKLKNTARQTAPEFDGQGLEYLKNAIQNMYTERSKMVGETKFIAIMPLPLAIQDTTGVEWNPSPSNFIEGAYGKIKKAGIGESSTYAAATTVLDAAGNYMGSGDWGTNGLTALQNQNGLAIGSQNNAMVERLINGHSELALSVANSPAANAYLKPGAGTKQILGMNSDASLMDFHNEAAALNGTRQVIFDPGYWQSFQGVQPRQFSLSWEIIPENHEDAINGLELCSRLREFSLPQSVSGVELLSPCYWRLDWSNEYLDAQTLYSNLVIDNIQIDYAQQGEWHGSSTPKMFRISISFKEAKAPTADIYKYGDNFIDVGTAARGTVRGKGRGGKRGNTGYDGRTGTLGSSTSVPFPNTNNIPSFPTDPGNPNSPIGIRIPGTDIVITDPKDKSSIFDIFKDSIDKIKSQVGKALGDAIEGILKGGLDNIGDKIEDILGNIGGDIGKKIGDKIDDIIEGALENTSAKAIEAIKEAIKTGDFSGISDKLKDAILKSDDLKQVFGDDTFKKLEDMLGGDFEEKFKDILEDIKSGKLNNSKLKEKIKERVKEIFRNQKPEVNEVVNKPSVLLNP